MAQERASAFPPGLAIYQIYPRSFMDGNGDGIGDLAGILAKLDYLAELGVNALWLCPVYPSPQVDFGYDVANYTDVDPQYGTLADLDMLIGQAHKKDIKIIMDLVLNHTSDQHPWFQESRSSLDNPKRDWYIWKSPRAGNRPPNNWLSTFGGSAWELDAATGQYYLHSFFKQQPDLNWENSAVRAALKEVMRFWLDRGVDGFRLDAVYWYGKDQSFHDDPANPAFDAREESPYDALLHTHSKRQPSVFAHLNELARFLATYTGRFMITEAYPHEPFNVPSYLEFYKQVDPLVAAPFNFMSFFLPWEAHHYQRLLDKFEAGLQPGYTPVYVLGNHDRQRLASRIGLPAARSAAMLQLTMPGVAVIYYGEELGMQNAVITGKDVLDGYEKNIPGLGFDRDVARTPMQWDGSQNAGFTTGRAWLPVAAGYEHTNVADESGDPTSLLNLYKKLLKLRQSMPALLHGTYEPLTHTQAHLFGFVRAYQGQRLAVVINFSSTTTIHLTLAGTQLLSTRGDSVGADVLLPSEGKIIELSPKREL